MLPFTVLTFLTFSLAVLAIFSLWFTNQRMFPWILFLGAVVLGFISETLTFQGVFYLAVFSCLLIAYYSLSYEKLAKPILGFAIALLGFLLINHYLPGFNKWKILPKMALGPTSKAYSLYYFFDRAAMGFLILAIAMPLINTAIDWLRVIRISIIYGLVAFLVIIGPSIVSHFATIDLKFPENTAAWLVYLFIFGSIPEECFFRGFIQKQTVVFLGSSKNGHWIGILAGTLMYSLQNLRSASWGFFIISMMAGFIFSLLYKKTDRIEAPIIAHFVVNAGQFFFLSYPIIAKSTSII